MDSSAAFLFFFSFIYSGSGEKAAEVCDSWDYAYLAGLYSVFRAWTVQSFVLENGESCSSPENVQNSFLRSIYGLIPNYSNFYRCSVYKKEVEVIIFENFIALLTGQEIHPCIHFYIHSLINYARCHVLQ